MLFSSTIFIYLFLPLTLLGYYICPRSRKNDWLLLTSLIFFAWGGVTYTLLLLGSIVLNYLFGIQVQRNLGKPSGRTWLVAGVTTNLLMLAVFKYTNFMIGNVNALTELLRIPPMPLAKILLPVGISFYTFHALSYLIDIYRGKVAAQRNILDLALYVSMFSQLVAGPIIRYSDVWQQLHDRTHALEKFSSGVERFLIGLAKKVLLANVFARVADPIFDGNLTDLGAANAWLGIVCYSLQIYYDFAGYSDMAIGLGRMFGFDFMENFNFPYLARSIKDFWRRWHISLSTFFRDYVYIPLGGNQKGTGRTYFNLVVVFFLTGFWHGASWSFVAWGLLHGMLMVIERLGFEQWLARTWRPVAHGYTLLAVMLTWVLFRANSFGDALGYWAALVDFAATDAQMGLFYKQFVPELFLALAVALLGAFGAFAWLQRVVAQAKAPTSPASRMLAYTYHAGSALVYAVLLIACTTYLVAGSYNPFIYYRF
jgi:alginate O-acetyltransferase complex protein AlgI